MKKPELKKIYADACSAASRFPDDAQFAAWWTVLGDREEQDVRAALVAWWGDSSALSDRDQRLTGSTMPSQAHLKAAADKIARERKVKAEPDFCGRCALGWVGKLVDGKIVRVPCECREGVLAARKVAA
jgi:hypothetical protein